MHTSSHYEHFPSESIKEIPKWTRHYARNRTLPLLLSLFLCLVWTLLSLLGVKLAVELFRKGDIIHICSAMAAVAVLVAFLVWFVVPRWGGRWFQNLTKRIYSKDGDVVLAVPAKQRTPNWPRYVLPGAFLLGVPISVILTGLGYLPFGYLQPVSAFYAVPLLILIFASMRSTLSPLFLLWPILYCIHAILIMAGAPITFAGPWRTLNLLIPTVGYGTITGVAGHLAGQYSLKRLREVAAR